MKSERHSIQPRVWKSQYLVPAISMLAAVAIVMPTSVVADSFTNSIGMKLTRIPAGEFLMGAGKDDDLAIADEQPRHRIRIGKPFYIGIHEVTAGQFRSCVNATGYRTAAETDGKRASGYNPETRGYEYDSPDYSWRRVGYPQEDNHPVVNVNWYDANTFCAWLSENEGRTYRLPTEAEWEYACRAGTTARFIRGHERDAVKVVANLCDQSLGRRWDTATLKKYGIDPQGIKFAPWDDGHPFTAPVGSFRPNTFGLYDMLGNAAEFCRNGYKSDYYRKSPAQSPAGPAEKQKGHVVRGGTFLNGVNAQRVSARVECPDTYQNYVIGFRVEMEPM